MTQDMRVLIVGAGPTGLTAAIELARRGIIPVLIEKRKTASTLSRAVGLLPNTMDILTASGAAKAIRKDAIPIQAAIFHNKQKPISTIKLNEIKGVNKRLYALPQDQTEAHLRDIFKALGGQIHYGAEFLSHAQSDDGVSVSILGQAFRFDYVIGADGVYSAVREALHIPFEGYDLPEKWSIADVEAKAWANPRSLCAFLCKMGRIAVVIPVQKNRYRVVSNTEDALATLPIPMLVQTVHRGAAFTISIRQATTYQKGRVFLAGDAAHCHSPVGGRGMNLGIADAVDLAERITTGTTDGYTAARHPIGKQTIRMSEKMRKALTSKTFIQRFILIRMLSLFARLDVLRHRFVKHTLDL